MWRSDCWGQKQPPNRKGPRHAKATPKAQNKQTTPPPASQARIAAGLLSVGGLLGVACGMAATNGSAVFHVLDDIADQQCRRHIEHDVGTTAGTRLPQRRRPQQRHLRQQRQRRRQQPQLPQRSAPRPSRRPTEVNPNATVAKLSARPEPVRRYRRQLSRSGVILLRNAATPPPRRAWSPRPYCRSAAFSIISPRVAADPVDDDRKHAGPHHPDGGADHAGPRRDHADPCRVPSPLQPWCPRLLPLPRRELPWFVARWHRHLARCRPWPPPCSRVWRDTPAPVFNPQPVTRSRGSH